MYDTPEEMGAVLIRTIAWIFFFVLVILAAILFVTYNLSLR
jgi:hypothetical protein